MRLQAVGSKCRGNEGTGAGKAPERLKNKQMTRNAYNAISSNLSLALKELAEKLSPTDPSLSVIINAGSNAAMWAHLPDEQEKWDRKELELVRANADYSDTWLMEVICELAGDLLQQGGK